MKNSHVVLHLVILVLLVIGSLTHVFAHANLVGSNPGPNSVLDRSPKQITLSFSEQVEPRFTQASVYDSNGEKVDSGYSFDANQPARLTISLPDLPSGVYTVVWEAISAIDGHSTAGSFSFGIGNVAMKPEPSQASAQFALPSPFEVVARWLNYLAEAAFLGGVVFVILVWMPTWAEKSLAIDRETNRRVLSRTARLLSAVAWIALLATIMSLSIQALTVSGEGSFDGLIAEVHSIVVSTRFGLVWLLRVATILCAISITRLLMTRTSKKSWTGALAVGGILALTTSISSHSAAATSYIPALNLGADWLHLVAVSVWVGGLLCFLLVLASIRVASVRAQLELIRRFSSLAVVSVGVIGITGLYSLLIEVGSLVTLFSTGYGILLLAKMSLFAPMIALGALNQFKVYNEIADRTKSTSSTPAPKHFSLSIKSEVALGVITLMIVGVLTASSPVAPTVGPTSKFSPQPTVLTGSSTEGINATLRILPLQVGSNHFEVDFSDPNGNAASNITEVELSFRYLDRNIGQTRGTAARLSQAQFALDGTYLSLPGKWALEVSARRSRGYDVLIRFQVEVPSLSLRYSERSLPSGSEPYGVAIDDYGVVWIAETGTGQIARYDPTTNTLTQHTLPRTGSKPFYLTIDQNGSIWISDAQYNQIVLFDPKTGRFDTYPIPTVGAVPGGIATDPRGLVWFTEEVSGKIGVLDPRTGEISELATPTPDSIPVQLVADQKGVIWFTEAKAGKIGRIDPTNWSISEFAPVNSTLLGPTGVAIGPDGEVWITEHSGNRITSFDPANQTFGGLVVPNNQAFPFGLAFHGKERVWFVEHIANSIATFDLNTGRYDSFPIPTPSSGAQLLAIDSGGNVWFTLPATNSFGVLTSTTSALQLETTYAPDQLVQLVLPAVVTIAVVTCIVLVAGQRSMKKKEESYQSCQGNQSC